MANTRIQVKRSATNSVIPALFQGEICYSANGTGAGVANPANSGLLFVGHPTSNAAVPVGGVLTMGTLTANQILSTNSTSGINQLICSNLSVNYVSLPSGYGGAGQVLASNGTSNAYWVTLGGGSGTVTSISMGNGLTSTQSPLTTTGTMSVNAGGSLAFTSGALGVNAAAASGLVANATGVWVQVANGLTVNATGFIAVNSSPAISVNTTGTFVNLAATSGLSTTSGLNIVVGNGHGLGASGLYVNAGGSIISNATGVYVNTATTSGLVANATGVWVLPGPTIVTNSTGTHVNTAASSGLIANATGLWAAVNTAQLVLAAGGITHNAAGIVTLQDLTCSGNLTVSGTLVSLNATDLQVKDNMIQLAANQSGQAGTFLAGDAFDSGLYYQIGNSSSNACFSGFTRLKNALGSSNTQPYFKIWAGNVAPSATSVTASNTGYLESFLVPYGAGGLFVANGTNISLSSNSTVALAIAGGATTTIAAGTLQLTTPLPVSNLAAGTDGQVLQYATGTGNLWGALDGGTFIYEWR